MDNLFNSHTYCLNASSKTEQTYMKKKKNNRKPRENMFPLITNQCNSVTKTKQVKSKKQNKG